MGSDVSRLMLLAGPLMIAVGLAFVVGWKARSRTPLRWFWAGAGIWAIGVVLKFGYALLLTEPVLSGLDALLPQRAYLAIGAIYIGLQTGVFEIGVTLAAALKWPSLARTARRAVAVGIGAGAFEAVLLGASAFIAMLIASSNLPGSQEARAAIASSAANAPLAWLVGPVERVIAILAHTASRTLVLLGVTRRRWCFFWYGFLLLTVVDAIAGFAHLSGALSQVSVWWIEVAIAPFAVASVPIVGWCMKQWPERTGEESQAT